MAKMLNETLGTVGTDGLIISNVPVADVVTVTLAAAQGIVKRGTLVVGTAGGSLSVISKALTATDAAYIVADDTDTAGGATTATAYRVGHFAKNKLVTGSYTLVAADVELLRKEGILLGDIIA